MYCRDFDRSDPTLVAVAARAGEEGRKLTINTRFQQIDFVGTLAFRLADVRR